MSYVKYDFFSLTYLKQDAKVKGFAKVRRVKSELVHVPQLGNKRAGEWHDHPLFQSEKASLPTATAEEDLGGELGRKC